MLSTMLSEDLEQSMSCPQRYARIVWCGSIVSSVSSFGNRKVK